MNSTELLSEVVKTRTGNEPQVGEPTCVLWKADHPNCEGCPSSLPCCQRTALALAMMASNIYKPKDYDDFSLQQKRLHELFDKILDLKTEDEIKALF